MKLAPLPALPSSHLLTPRSSLPSPTPSLGSEIKLKKGRRRRGTQATGSKARDLSKLLRLSEESHLLVISTAATPTLHPSLLWKSLPQPPALPLPTRAPPPPPLLFFNYFSILLSLYGWRWKDEQALPGARSGPVGWIRNFEVRQEWTGEAASGSQLPGRGSLPPARAG